MKCQAPILAWRKLGWLGICSRRQGELRVPRTRITADSTKNPNLKAAFNLIAPPHLVMSASPSPPTPRESLSPETSSSHNCQWLDCTKSFFDPEILYSHLCNDHIGRKSTNNLCLVCKWKDCVTTCTKRDHITSHLRGLDFFSLFCTLILFSSHTLQFIRHLNPTCAKCVPVHSFIHVSLTYRVLDL